jgi:hypothetical protein
VTDARWDAHSGAWVFPGGRLLVPSGLPGGAELCPHPERLREHAIGILASRPPFICCGPCKRLLDSLIDSWGRRELGPARVIAELRANGYTRRDAARFLLQLVGDRLRVRLGFAR